MTTVYLIRHSIRLPKRLIDSYNTKQDDLLKAEKIILSVEGEKRAEILANEEELSNIDVVYTSNCVRTIATAKYLCLKQHLHFNIDERFDERRVGIPNEDKYPDWWTRQYKVSTYKTEGGESQEEVRNRVLNALYEVINKYKDKRIAIFTHGYAITFLLLKWCKLERVTKSKIVTLSYKDRIIFDKEINAPEVFKLTFDENNEIKDIELIEFSDLPFKKGD